MEPNGKLQVLVTVVRDLGFPIFVAGFLLWKFDTTINLLTLAITDMHAAVSSLNTHINEDSWFIRENYRMARERENRR